MLSLINVVRSPNGVRVRKTGRSTRNIQGWRVTNGRVNQTRTYSRHVGPRSYLVPLLESVYSSSYQYYVQSARLSREMTPSSRILAGSPRMEMTMNTPKWTLRFLDTIKRILKRYWDYILVILRGTEIALILSPMLVLTPAAIVADRWMYTAKVSDLSWNYLVSSVQFLGPAFIKLCQWAATRRDIFPPHICDRLSKLQADGLPHSWVHSNQTLQEAFGDYRAKGLFIEPQDIVGCGSAAQVYSGTLNVTNSRGEVVQRPVAVKILHPHFHEMIERDIWFMQAVANAIHAIPLEFTKVLNVPGATSTFTSVLEKQADLTIEAENLKRFRANFYKKQDESDSAIFFPCPMEGWIAPNALVEDLVDDGVPIAEYLRDDTTEGRKIRKELAGPLLRAFLKMVFIDNWVHCDIHPGNVLIRTSEVKKHESMLDKMHRIVFDKTPEDTVDEHEIKRTIVFLDAGIATELGDSDRKNLYDLFRAVLTNKGAEAGRLMVERAKHERCSQMEGGVEAFSNGIAEIVAEFHDRRKHGLTLGSVRIGSLLSRVLDLCRIYGVEVDPAMANVVISTLVLEGLGRSLEPSLNLIDFALPFVIGRGRV